MIPPQLSFFCSITVYVSVFSLSYPPEAFLNTSWSNFILGNVNVPSATPLLSISPAALVATISCPSLTRILSPSMIANENSLSLRSLPSNFLRPESGITTSASYLLVNLISVAPLTLPFATFVYEGVIASSCVVSSTSTSTVT